jgi:hypothetical protein
LTLVVIKIKPLLYIRLEIKIALQNRAAHFLTQAELDKYAVWAPDRDF